MPNIKRLLLDSCCYHLITRGNQKQMVFRCDADNLEYLKLLKHFKRKYNFRLYAYCLMPNHIHLVGEINDAPLISNFMHDLNRTYTLYFNSKYNLVGHLWQGRFKSKVICKDRYLIDCLRYIEYNPVRANIVQSASEYKWSSYPGRVLDERNGIIDEMPPL